MGVVRAGWAEWREPQKSLIKLFWISTKISASVNITIIIIRAKFQTNLRTFYYIRIVIFAS